MDNKNTNYNIEDTGKLLTQARSGNSMKKYIIIGAAIIAVIVVAVFGIKAAGDKRYNDQVEIAEKAMLEDDYAGAEEAYLAAVGLNGKKLKAREGLAYVYMLEEKYDEAESQYSSLYQDTKDDRYQIALDDARNHRPPSDPSLAVQTSWKVISLEKIPYSDYFNDFISATAWDNYQQYSYDSTKVSDGKKLDNLFRNAFFANMCVRPAEEYSEEYYDYDEYVFYPEDYDEGDPRGWYSDYDYNEYTRTDKARTDDALRRTFCCSDEQIEEIIRGGEELRTFYCEGDYYYRDMWADESGVPSYTYEVTSIRTNGIRYCVTYDSGYAVETDWDYDYDRVDRTEPYITYYELLEYKVIDGQHYLTMLYNGPEEPEEISAAGSPPPETEAQDDGVYDAYAKVLRDHEGSIMRYTWQQDADNDTYNMDSVGESVALFDLDEDGTPELMFMEAVEDYLAAFRIYTYADGRAVECSYTINDYNNGVTEQFADVAVAGGTRYMIYAGKDPGVLHIAHCITDETESLTNNEMLLSSGGSFRETGYIHNYFSLISDDKTDNYYIDGELVKRDKGIAAFKAAGEDYRALIMFSGRMDELSVGARLDKDQPVAMTYNEALNQLESH